MRKAAHKPSQIDYARARKLRHESTPHEQKLWRELQIVSKKFGIKFRRQHPLHPYIADFVCLDVKLVIELDGSSHDRSQDYDQKRDDYLQEHGFKTIRFHNQEIASDIKSVVKTILDAIGSLEK